MAADFLLILLSYAAGASLYGAAVTASADGASVGAGLFVGVVFVAVAYFRDVYATHRLLNVVWQLRKAVLIWLTSLTILAVAAFLLKSTDNLSRGTVIVFAVIGGLGLISLRFVWQVVFGTSFARSRLVDRKVILLSLKPLDFTSSRFKDLRRNGFDVMRHFVLGADRDDGQWERQIRDVIRQSRSADVDEYLLAIDWNELPMLRKLSPFLRAVPQPIRLLPDDPVADLVARPFLPVSGTVAVEIQRPPLTILERLQKRCLDIGVAVFALVMLTPLLLTVAVLIKLDSPGTVIFRQSRRGFNGRPFEIWKFRTMTVSENGETVTQATKRDARVTKIGRFLRMTSIDELPQLWNVLRGDMSLVGPRPHALAHDNYYDESHQQIRVPASHEAGPDGLGPGERVQRGNADDRPDGEEGRVRRLVRQQLEYLARSEDHGPYGVRRDVPGSLLVPRFPGQEPPQARAIRFHLATTCRRAA
ncbi:sugar transferase [Bradyrhizobium guangxiense]